MSELLEAGAIGIGAGVLVALAIAGVSAWVDYRRLRRALDRIRDDLDRIERGERP